MKYSLERKSYVQSATEKFSSALDSSFGFVTCSMVTGLGLGIVYNMSTKEFKLENSKTIIASGAVYYAKKVYDNFKKERVRVNQLALEIDKERNKETQEVSIISNQLSEQNKQIAELQQYRDILTSNQNEQKTGATNGKRKALNNGIFKANDNQ